MADQIVENYIANVKKEVLQENMRDIPLAYLMQTAIPESIKHYFNHEVENWILEEEAKFESSERFDYDIPEVRMKIDQIFDHLKNTATFSTNQFNQLLERAVKLERSFTIQPQRTLTQFLFKNNTEVRTKQVNDTLNYFFVHEYYKQKLTEYFDLKYLQQINLEQFKALLKQIDEQVFNADLKTEALKLVKAIAELISKGSDDGKIPLEEIVKAFEDRSLNEYSSLFNSLLSKGIETLSLQEIEEAIDNSDKTQTHVAEETISLDDIDISAVQMEAPVAEEDEEDDDFDEEEDELSESENAEAVGDQLSDMVASQMDSGKPLQDLNELIDKKQRKLFLKKLFKKDEAAFEDFIAEINELTSWKDASYVIEDEFYNRDINPYSKEATMFSDICYNRFFPTDEYVG